MQPKNHSKKIYLVIVIVIILGILFFVKNKKEVRQAPIMPNDVQMEQIQTQGTTDEVDAIEMDLNNTNIDSLDQ